ncbi:MAG: CHAD domain-containing protein [Caldilineaceae bacterium]|nr:CHAD domain-containing protein [Caldilineaceae bacterium]
MSSTHLVYEISTDVETAVLTQRLQERFSVQMAAPVACEGTYYDTFDWRLYAAGSLLEVSAEESGFLLQWRKLDDDRPQATLATPTMPRFAWDLPAGPLRAALEPLLTMRALLPVIRTRVVGRAINVLNEDEKTVLRLSLQGIWVIDDAGDVVAAAPTRLTLWPVKGYDLHVAEMQTVLEQEAGVSISARPLLASALAAVGRKPGDYSGKLDVLLRPEMTADSALKTILLELLVTMEQNEPGLIADLDSEFLHDFRVAVRRTRSALSQVRGVLPSEIEQHFRGEFGWLGEMTGPTRDLDVYLLQFEEYRADLPPFARDDPHTRWPNLI